MKKVFLMFAVVGIIGLSSCSKEFTCKCDDDFFSYEIEAKKGDAEDTCEATSSSLPNVNCELE